MEMLKSEYQIIMENMQVGVNKVVLDDKLTFIWANPFFYQQFGYNQEEFVSKYPTLYEMLINDLDTFETVKHNLQDAYHTQKGKIQFDISFPVYNEGYKWFRMNATVIDSEGNDYPEFTIVYSPIDDIVQKQKRAERLYDRCSQDLQWIMSEYEGNVYLTDMETNELLYLNKKAMETLKITMAKARGKKCYEVIQGRDTPCPFCTSAFLKEDETYTWEFYNPTLERSFLIKNRQLDWDGRKIRIELSNDMFSTEYKLTKKDQEREAILNSIPGGLARIDARDFGTVLWYNERFLEVIGYTSEQFENELNSQCSYIEEEDLKRVLELSKTLTETGDNVIFEAKMKRRNGEERILMITLCYLGEEDSWDGIPSFYSVGLDVTEERKEQERQRIALEEAYQIAKIANSAKTDFLSSMSHDIRTPMNAIVGMAAIAQANISSPEKVYDCLNKIKVSSRHLLSLINEVLDMSKIESGKIDLMLEKVELSELIENVSDMCRSLVDEKHQDFNIIVGRIKHEKIIADGDRLKQVFMNLISNAVKYTPEYGNITMTIDELGPITSNKVRFEFVISDTGIGMSEDFLPHIFEPFSRAEDTRINKIQGTGLGLSITENIVQMMNGTIEVVSQMGKGTTFTVSVPLQVQFEEDVKEEKLIGKSVLIVDNDQFVCESAAMLVDELGMRGEWVLSGSEAVHKVIIAQSKNDQYFAVIIDWRMPDMDGLETVKTIRKKLDKAVPIIIVSAYDLSDIEEEFTRAGADAFITKPLFKSKILHILSLFSDKDSLLLDDDVSKGEHSCICGKRVLLVEDNELNRDIADELLVMQGVLVETAENGQDALETFEKSSQNYYDAILMDVQMPVMNGYEATLAIRQLEREDAATIPIIALTANVFFDDIMRAQRAGMNDHVAKPIDIDCLISVLEKYIDAGGKSDEC